MININSKIILIAFCYCVQFENYCHSTNYSCELDAYYENE